MYSDRETVDLNSAETFILTGYSPSSEWRGEHVLLQSVGPPLELLGYARHAEWDGPLVRRMRGSYISTLFGSAREEVHIIVSDAGSYGREHPSRLRPSRYAALRR